MLQEEESAVKAEWRTETDRMGLMMGTDEEMR